MKKLFTILCATVLTCSLYAQKEAGTKFIALNDCLDMDFSDPGSTDAGMSGGYFVINGLAITAGFEYSQVGEGEGDTQFDLGARFYMGSLFPFLKYDFAGEGTLHLGAGYSWAMTDNLALEPSFDIGMAEEDKTFGLKMGFALYF